MIKTVSKKTEKSVCSLIICMLLCLVLFILLMSVYYSFFKQANISEAAGDDVFYIQTESDFEAFLLDGLNNNLLSGSPDPLWSVTTGRKYILCNDIYLTRKNVDVTAEKIWISGYFNGEFDGRGHSIIGFEIDNQRAWYTNGEKNIAESNGYALFSVIGKNGCVKNLNIIDANVSFEKSGAAILVGTNSGIVENVKVQGTVNGYKWAGGICNINLGTIKNSLSMARVTVSKCNPFDHNFDNEGFSVAGYITAMNTADVYGDPGGDNAFKLLNNIYHCYNDDALNTQQMGIDVDWSWGGNTVNYVQNKAPQNVQDANPNSYLAEQADKYLIKDYLGVVWYLDHIKTELDKPEPDVNNIKSALLQNDINLYNVEINPIYATFYKEVLSGVSDELGLDLSSKLAKNGFNYYNRDRLELDFYGFEDKVRVNVPNDVSVTLNGEGTKSNPYLINSVDDLIVLSYVPFETGLNAYYMLTNNIDLSSYMLAQPLLGTLSGVLDGNGYSISNIFGHSLVASISATGTIKNLRLSGVVSGDYALVTQDNKGTIEGIDVDIEISSTNGVGIAYQNEAIITLSTLRTTGSKGTATMAGNILGNSLISHTRAMALYISDNCQHDVPFIGVDSSSTNRPVEYCTNVNAIWGVSEVKLSNCAWFGAGGVIGSTGESIYSLVQTNNINQSLHDTGWAYPLRFSDLGMFAYQTGLVEDVPELVFPNDNKTYKEVTFLTDTYTAPIVKRYASNPVFYAEMLIDKMAVDSAEWLALENAFSGEGIVIKQRVEDGAYIIGLNEGESNITKLAIEVITKQGLSDDIKTLISSTIFEWDTEGSDLLPRDNAYYFHMYSEYVDISGAFLLNGGSSILNFRRKDYTTNTNSVFYDEIFPSLPTDLVDGDLGFKVAKKDTPSNYLADTIINDLGEYVFSALVEGNTQRTRFYKEYQFTLQKGIFDMTNLDLTSKIGGLNTSVNAPIFNAAIVDYEDALCFNDIKSDLYSKQLTINKLIRSDGSEQSVVSDFMFAGEYKCVLNISSEKYETKEFYISLFVNPKNLTVSSSINSHEVFYGDPTPGITSSFEGVIYNYPVSIHASSTYIAGVSDIGTYEVILVVDKALDTNKNYLNYNISLTPNKLTFIVNPANLDLPYEAFPNKGVDYNGAAHMLVVDRSKVNPATANISVKYRYANIMQTEAFSFINAGSYNVTAVISAGVNYNEKEVTSTLIINKLMVQIKAEDKEIIYGDIPNWSFKVVANEELSALIRAELLKENKSFDYYCEYSSSSPTGWPDKWDANNNCYELPIQIMNYTNISNGVYSNIGISPYNNSSGFLRVRKMNYSPQLVTDKITYTGNMVQLSFKYSLEPVNKQWHSIDASDATNKTPLGQAPVNVSLYEENNVRPQSNKYMLRCDFLGDYKYSPLEGAELIFDIVQAELGLQGLYLISPEGVYETNPINQGKNIGEYMGADWQVYIKNSELPPNLAVEISYGGHTTNGPITFKNAGEYRDISLAISYANDNEIKNYKPFNKHYPEGVIIIPRAGEMSSYKVNNTYTGVEITPSFAPKEGFYVGEDVFDLEAHLDVAIDNYLLYRGDGDINDSANYIECTINPTEIVFPGLYKIRIKNTNPNYRLINLDANNTKEAIVIVTPAEVNLDLTTMPIIEEIYLSQRSSLLQPRLLNITLGGNNIQKEVSLGINSAENAFPIVGLYDIDRAERIYHQFNTGEHVLCISFIITGGENKFKVNPRYISFNWSDVITENVFYKSPELNKFVNGVTTLEYKKGDNSPLVLIPGIGENVDLKNLAPASVSRIRITVDKANIYELSAGDTFMLNASLTDSVNFKLVEEVQTEMNINIQPRTVMYIISKTYMYSGESLPVFCFDAVHFILSADELEVLPADTTIGLIGDEETLSILQIEKSLLDIEFNVIGYAPTLDLAGEFMGEIKLLLNGKVYPNFNLEKEDGVTKEIFVSKHIFNVQIPDVYAEYDGDIKLPEITNLEGASVSHNCFPKEAGSYNLITTISKIHYETVNITSNVVVKKARATINTEQIELPYCSDYNLVSTPLNITVMHNNINIPGSAGIKAGQVLLLGTNSYEALFIPEDQNNYEQIEFNVVVKTYVNPTDFTFYGGNKIGENKEITFENNTIVTDADIYTLSFSKREGLPNMYMKVNGKLVGESNEYVFEQSEDNVNVQLIAADGSNAVLFETTINVRLANGVNEITPSIEDSPVDSPAGSNEIAVETKKLTPGGIAGIVMGSIAFIAIVVLATILLIKKRKKV